MSDSKQKEIPVVLHIFSGDLWAGAEVMVFHLLSQLQQRENIKVIAFSLNEGMLSKKLRSRDVDTYVFQEGKNSFFRIFKEALSTAKGKNISIIHSHRYKENLLGFLLGKFLGIKHSMTTLHGLPEPLSTGEKQGKAEKSLGMSAKVNYFMMRHFFSCVVAVSQDIKKVLIKKHQFRPKNIVTIYNGIEVPKLLPSPTKTEEEVIRVGSVGRMVPVKDFELFLKVALELKKHFRAIQFSVLGDGPLSGYLLEQRDRLGLGGCVEFIPPVSDPLPFYASLDMYLNTSIHEGIPLSILEAMSCGLAVVAPKVGGIPEIIDHGSNGVLFDSRDPVEIAKMCIQLLDTKDAKSRIGIKARKKVQESFSNTSMADNYYRQYILLLTK